MIVITVPGVFFSLSRAEYGELVDVGPGDERLLSSAGQDDRSDLVIGFERVEGRVEVSEGRGVQGVQHLRAIERQDRDSPVTLVQQVVKGHGERLMIPHAHAAPRPSAAPAPSAITSRRSGVRPGTND